MLSFGDKLLRKIAAHFEEPASTEENPVEWAWATLTSNPYALIRDLDGYAFRTADIVARKAGLTWPGSKELLHSLLLLFLKAVIRRVTHI